MKKSTSFWQGTIEYYDMGEGSVIVLLHGYLESSEVWENFIPGLAESFRVIAIDLPGHGRSSVYGDNHSMDLMADAVIEVMNNEGIEKTMLIGHSMGGYVALAFLEKYQSRLHAYCLFHSHPFADTDEIITNREREKRIVESGKKDVIYTVNIPRMFADFNRERYYEELERHQEIASVIPAEGIIAALNGMISRPSRIKILEQGAIPLLMIFGKHDNYIPYQVVRNKIQVPWNAKILVLETSGHLGFVEEKKNSQKAITDFYNKQLK